VCSHSNRFDTLLYIALGVFYPVLIRTTAGVLEIDRIYPDVGRNFGAGRWQTFLHDRAARRGAARYGQSSFQAGSGQEPRGAVPRGWMASPLCDRHGPADAGARQWLICR